MDLRLCAYIHMGEHFQVTLGKRSHTTQWFLKSRDGGEIKKKTKTHIFSCSQFNLSRDVQKGRGVVQTFCLEGFYKLLIFIYRICSYLITDNAIFEIPILMNFCFYLTQNFAFSPFFLSQYGLVFTTPYQQTEGWQLSGLGNFEIYSLEKLAVL